MSRQAYLRILVYTTSIIMYIGNMFYMTWVNRNNPVVNEQVEQFKSLELRFFTTWTYLLQVGYAIFALGCDLFIVKNAKNKNYSLPSPITDFREIIFSGLVWPCTMVVFTIFWGLYTYDRRLIFPEFLDAVIPPISNHVIHTMIVPVVVCEVVLRPRKVPENHARNVMQLTLHLCVYFSVLYFTYIERGIWLYPIFKKLFGTIYFAFAIAAIAALFYIFYYIQWPITNLIHGSKKKVEKKKAKLEKKVK